MLRGFYVYTSSLMDAKILKLVKTKGVKAPLPKDIKPMLCTLIKEAPDDPAYVYEVKWDGYRILSFANKSKVKMGSRSGLDYTSKYPPIARALADLKINAI